MKNNLLIMQVDKYGLPIYQHTFDIFYSLKEYSWLNRCEYDIIKVSTFDELSKISLPENTNIVVSGSVEFCYQYYPKTSLSSLYKEIHYRYTGRKIWNGKKSDIKSGIFVKPLDDIKLFTGFVIKNVDHFDFFTDGKVLEDTQLLFSEEISILDEYRTWFSNGKTLDIRPYYKKDKIGLELNIPLIEECNKEISSLYKKSFSADYGITNNGETVLIEVNDKHGTGTYGFNGPNLWQLMIN